MRITATFIFFMIAAITSEFLTPANAAPSPWCFGIYLTDCKDPRLTALHRKVEDLYAKALSQAQGPRRQALMQEHRYWLVSRGSKCAVPVIEWVTGQAVRRARPCLIAVYQARIAKLSKLLTPSTESPSEERAIQEVDKTAQKPFRDMGTVMEKGDQDAGKTAEKGVQDVGKAACVGLCAD
jgi:uncharacterized protein YecT (DUF1311 family)